MITPYAEASNAWLNDPTERLKRKNAFDLSLVMDAAEFPEGRGQFSPKSRPFLWAIDRDTGLIRDDMVTARRCPVCDEPNGRGLFVKDGFRHIKCLQCGLIYVNLILCDDVRDKYWREELAWQQAFAVSQRQDLDILKFNYGLDVVGSHVEGRRLLDIGHGNDIFTGAAGDQGWAVTVLEVNLENPGRSTSESFKMIVKPMEMSDLSPESFDVIFFWEILEHLADPLATLTEARHLLAPEGMFLILVPNAYSLATRLLHDKSNIFDGYSHLNHFFLETLSRLLDNAGLKILETETIITELGMINNHLAFEDPYNGEAEPLLPELTPSFIHNRLWGSRLLAVAGKK